MFLPIVAGLGGNAGTQTLTLMVRGFALGELDLHEGSRVLRRQTLIGTMNGFVAGAALALISWVWEQNLLISESLWIAGTVRTSRSRA